jgi:hypothetical protein
LRRLVTHAHRHSIAYVALACSLLALAGASYAAFRVPNNSVGERQIKNRAIDPVKWDPTYVTGFVRRWASVGADGQLLSSSNFGTSTETSPGNYVLTWGDAFSSRCIANATVEGGSTTNPTTTTSTTSTTTTTAPTTSTSTTTPPGVTTSTTTPPGVTTSTTTTTTTPQPPGGFADASIVTATRAATLVGVATYDTAGEPTPEAFSVAIICPPGAGGSQTFPAHLP